MLLPSPVWLHPSFSHFSLKADLVSPTTEVPILWSSSFFGFLMKKQSDNKISREPANLQGTRIRDFLLPGQRAVFSLDWHQNPPRVLAPGVQRPQVLGCPSKAERLGGAVSHGRQPAPGKAKGLSQAQALAALFSITAKRNPLTGHKAEPQQTGNWVPFAERCHGEGQRRCSFMTFKSMNSQNWGFSSAALLGLPAASAAWPGCAGRGWPGIAAFSKAPAGRSLHPSAGSDPPPSPWASAPRLLQCSQPASPGWRGDTASLGTGVPAGCASGARGIGRAGPPQGHLGHPTGAALGTIPLARRE